MSSEKYIQKTLINVLKVKVYLTTTPYEHSGEYHQFCQITLYYYTFTKLVKSASNKECKNCNRL